MSNSTARTMRLLWLLGLLVLSDVCLSARLIVTKTNNTVTVTRAKDTPPTSASEPRTNSSIFQVEDLCVRIHNNTIFTGVAPYETLKLKSAHECQKHCMEEYPSCVAVVFYFVHLKKGEHICYLFDKNSVDEEVTLTPEKPKREEDIIRALEVVVNCHQFDAFPPLSSDDGVVSSTDHAPRNKRENSFDSPVRATGSWSAWGSCGPSTQHQVRSQTCDYGRNIQRRGCPSREYPPAQQAVPTFQPQPVQYPPKPYARAIDAQARSRYHAVPYPDPCPGNVCANAMQSRPPPPPAPACRSQACQLPQRQVEYGNWQEWSDWSECSCTCGDGIQQRQRLCSNGRCLGEAMETSPCNMGPCDTWSQWCEWSACRASCGAGERIRTRYCELGTQRCDGSDFEVEQCNAGPCPEWSSWEDWTPCSVSCGDGFQSRQRTCLGGLHGQELCSGDRVEQQRCDLPPCSFWEQWQEWSSCSVTCGDGVKRRQRVCQYGNDCHGEDEETLFCFGPPCSAWTEWCEWSDCSSQCGAGQRLRLRTCLTANGSPSEDCIGPEQESTLCNERECCQWTEWCPWSECSRDCGGGLRERSRVCQRPGESHFGDDCQCPGPDRETAPCNEHACAPQCAWSSWCAWSACSVQSACEIGLSTRTRQCVGEHGCTCNGQGFAEDRRQCRGEAPCTPPPCRYPPGYGPQDSVSGSVAPGPCRNRNYYNENQG
ncbi:hypothetical protein QR680_017286 [Steinernema hermaphroditum]|uniref:Apple domain-containing protein n=1 Tax=Steinernema hermaphroditum TaxID=289476 RepID=A0AA39HG63_9BILA|nr:hypothetical protein QR680_017286 [Steinernema hermaphroditum]